MKEIKPIHRVVATELAKGASLTAICEHYGLNPDTWRVIASAPLFKNEVDQLSRGLAQKELDAFSADPIRRKIHEERSKSVERIAKERDEFDPEIGASSATRIKAARSLLELSGDFVAEETSAKQNITIVIPPAVAEHFSQERAATIDLPPANFTVENVRINS